MFLVSMKIGYSSFSGNYTKLAMLLMKVYGGKSTQNQQDSYL